MSAGAEQLVPYQMKGIRDIVIQNPHQYLQYLKFDEEDGAVFRIQKIVYMTGYHVAFDLRYYPAYQGFEGSRSGATIFRPSQNASLRYSNITQVLLQKSDLVSQITLLYDNAKGEQATVKARLTFDSPLIEWEVSLEEVPVADRRGKEVTVNFRSYQIDSLETFWTDQSGLEMTVRERGYRMSNYHIPQSYHNISVNFYPVTSAIVIKDLADEPAEQMTIMVDRTVGATAGLKPGLVEILHTRRLLSDDTDSVGVVLNETYDTPSTVYTMQMFDRRFEEPLQRR